MAVGGGTEVVRGFGRRERVCVVRTRDGDRSLNVRGVGADEKGTNKCPKYPKRGEGRKEVNEEFLEDGFYRSDTDVCTYCDEY